MAWQLDVGRHRLEGSLDLPTEARGVVVFAHGSGSSRNSPRNRRVADALRGARLGTLLFDLLSAEEARRDAADRSLRFDIGLLAARLTAAVDAVASDPVTAPLPVGLFGASTGAAAALATAADRSDVVASVVSRGGRPDLAGAALGRVRSPTLLIVGEWDREVLRLNQDAARQLAGPHEISVVPRATHLFEEPGALEEVTRRAIDWFDQTLPQARDRT